MDIKGIADISGFGKDTPYEDACQKMLQAGYDWLVDNGKADLKAKTLKGVYGVLEPNSPDAEALSKAVTGAVPDCTGAMHQAVMGHLFFINKNGVDKWKSELEKDES